MNEIFDLCVTSLNWLAGLTGMTYEQINVVIFCITWPVIALLFIGNIIYLKRMISRLSRAS